MHRLQKARSIAPILNRAGDKERTPCDGGIKKQHAIPLTPYRAIGAGCPAIGYQRRRLVSAKVTCAATHPNWTLAGHNPDSRESSPSETASNFALTQAFGSHSIPRYPILSKQMGNRFVYPHTTGSFNSVEELQLPRRETRFRNRPKPANPKPMAAMVNVAGSGTTSGLIGTETARCVRDNRT